MLSGQFERKLRKLNHRIRVYAADSARAAGIFVVSPAGEYTEICAADKNFVPEFMTYSADGRIVKSGWRRTLKILIARGLVRKEQAEKEFGTKLYECQTPKRKIVKDDPFWKKMESMGLELVSEGSF
jgi:hypothetical protein